MWDLWLDALHLIFRHDGHAGWFGSGVSGQAVMASFYWRVSLMLRGLNNR